MWNNLFSIGPITVHGYGLMIAIGVMMAMFIGVKRAPKLGLDKDHIYNLTFYCLIFGLIGAKLLFGIVEIKKIIEDPSFFLSGEGFVVYGGIITGVLTGFIYCRVKHLEFFRYADIVLPSVAVAQGFGRIGCFLAGCCYGVETNSVIGITFTQSQYAINHVDLVPTQLISSGLNFLHFFVLIIIAKRIKVHGVIAGCYLMFYSAGRFILEFFRGDLDRGNVGSISTSQFIAIFTFLFGLAVVVIQLMRNAKKAETYGEMKAERFEEALLENVDEDGQAEQKEEEESQE